MQSKNARVHLENSDKLEETLINDDKTLIKVVESDQVKKEANMDKLLKDWTLGECKEWCAKHDEECPEKCPIKEFCIQLQHEPAKWDLHEKPRFTQQEAERAKAIRVIWPNAERIQGSCGSLGAGLYYVWFSSVLLGQINGDDCFPSLGAGESVTLDEIIGGAE